ncbi:protein of unknown function [Tangfeifania diversioriginum]|uniref:DUF4062 domain-containing protein n=1 Tax=Tangfeifania diversioriginum TaxID=1168035 RepID=A0A1M6EKP2_9BACT|nr:DUF4062 domain-containing protein [Tangfeifania diversioriginum]SHI86105.1 protein of unknown function [Tangfeifania diversioriginum]
MNLQPTIFISSIISEFYDLRGALKYFLGKSGFRVLMSEEPDFGADCGIDSLDNCKNQIEKSDYYLLLIGDKPGTEFEIDGKQTTVTFEEFRHYIRLVKAGKRLNFIAFVRQQTWTNYTNDDLTKIHPLQKDLINELLNNTLFENQKIGRWRYTFEKFSDIITTLETNQNGLFLEATRKASIYKTYIKREILDIYKFLIEKKSKTNEIIAITEMVELPELNLDFLNRSYVNRETAAKIQGLLVITSKKNSLVRKINRVFNYIAQGEFSRFDNANETYVLPEYIKLIVQTLEILEKIFDNANNTELFNTIVKRDTDNFQINGGEYMLVKSIFSDLKLCIMKLSVLVTCFNENWYDIEKRNDEFYSYRGGVKNINDEEAKKYAKYYLNK